MLFRIQAQNLGRFGCNRDLRLRDKLLKVKYQSLSDQRMVVCNEEFQCFFSFAIMILSVMPSGDGVSSRLPPHSSSRRVRVF